MSAPPTCNGHHWYTRERGYWACIFCPHIPGWEAKRRGLGPV